MASLKGDDGTPSGFNPNAPDGVWGDSGSPGPFGGGGNGVVGSSRLSSGVAGFTLQDGAAAAGVFGTGPFVGLAGQLTGTAGSIPQQKVAVYGSGSNGANLDGIGVQGVSDTNVGVHGQSDSGVGVRGDTSAGGRSFGVVGMGPNAGVAAFNPNNSNAAYLASDCCAAWFTGPVHVAGNLSKSGGGFLIDHPLDAEGTYLSHSFVESSERKNVYDGIATADSNGEAVVELPTWFGALNTGFRYQLTTIGAPAPSLHVAAEIQDNRFKIAGAPPGGKVSWLVTGMRDDPWARAHPLTVEDAKPDSERGHYFHPELYGASKDHEIAQIRHPH